MIFFDRSPKRHGGRDLGDVAHLAGQVGRHGVDIVGQVFPRAGDALHLRLAAELAVRADFAGDAGDFRRERVQLIDHRVDGVFQREDFALHVDGDLLRQIAACDRGRHLGDVAHLAGEVARHRIDVVGQVLPGAADALDMGLAAKLAVRADLARDARDLRRERVQLIDHRVDGVLQRQDFALHVHGDLLRQIAARDGGGHFGDVAHLACQVRRHQVHVVGQILPGAADALDFGLAAELAFGADFSRDARHFGSEGIELVHHRVDGVLELQDFALDHDGDLLGQVAGRNGGRDLGDVAHLAGQIVGHEVDVVGQVLPGAAYAAHLRLAAELAFGADFAGHARNLGGERIQLIHHRVDGVFQFQDFAFHVDGDLLRQVPRRHRGRDLGDVTDLTGQIVGHEVDVVGQVLPGAADAFDLRLAAELAFGADFTRHTGHFGSERIQLVHHRVYGVLQFKDLALHVDGDLLRQVAGGDGGRDFGDVAHLSGQVGRHRVDVVGKILPGAGHALHARLSAELAFGADLARDARHFGSERGELTNHGVDDLADAKELASQRPAVDFDHHRLRQVALGDRADDAGHFGGGLHHILDQVVDRAHARFPTAGGVAHMAALTDPAVLADYAGKPLEFARQLVVQLYDFVEGIGDFGIEPVIGVLKANRKITATKSSKRGQNLAAVELFSWSLDVHGTLL